MRSAVAYADLNLLWAEASRVRIQDNRCVPLCPADSLLPKDPAISLPHPKIIKHQDSINSVNSVLVAHTSNSST